MFIRIFNTLYLGKKSPKNINRSQFRQISRPAQESIPRKTDNSR